MRWASEGVFRKMAMPLLWWKPGQYFLGRTRFKYDSRSRRVGIRSTAHVLLLGLTGAGKSIYVLFHNIAKFRGSCLILDPAGELANITAWYRMLRGCACIYLDSFSLTKYSSHCYNPLWDIDPYDPNAASLISAIVAGCVVQGSGGESIYFAENTKLPLKGLIAHFLTTRPRDQQNLPAIADAIIEPDDFSELLKEMANNNAVGGLPSRAAAYIIQSHDRQFGQIYTDIVRSLEWTTHPLQRKHLIQSDFSLRQLKDGKTAVYVSLPVDEMDVTKQGRYMRVLTNMTVAIVLKGEKPKRRLLMVIDEAPSLGRNDVLAQNFQVLRKRNCKLLVAAQGAKDIALAMGDAWHSLANNADLQVLGIRCEKTRQMIAERLGEYRKRDYKGAERNVPLMTPAEIGAFLGQESANQIILPVSGMPWQIKSVNWFRSRRSYRWGIISCLLERYWDALVLAPIHWLARPFAALKRRFWPKGAEPEFEFRDGGNDNAA